MHTIYIIQNAFAPSLELPQASKNGGPRQEKLNRYLSLTKKNNAY